MMELMLPWRLCLWISTHMKCKILKICMFKSDYLPVGCGDLVAQHMKDSFVKQRMGCSNRKTAIDWTVRWIPQTWNVIEIGYFAQVAFGYHNLHTQYTVLGFASVAYIQQSPLHWLPGLYSNTFLEPSFAGLFAGACLSWVEAGSLRAPMALRPVE